MGLGIRQTSVAVTCEKNMKAAWTYTVLDWLKVELREAALVPARAALESHRRAKDRTTECE